MFDTPKYNPGTTRRIRPTKIKLSDPAVKQLGANENDVLEITRNSQTAGEHNYYRVVVK